MILFCDDAKPGEVCDNCERARGESSLVTAAVMKSIKNKEMTETQQLRAVILGCLSCVELIAGKENIIVAGDVLIATVNTWLDRVAASHVSELNKQNSVANVVIGTKTIN